MRVAFVTNFCPHYRIQTFEMLSRREDVDFYFFSTGDEWYWQQQHGTQTGNFRYEYLGGVHIGPARLTPTLPLKLWRTNYDAYIKCINGRFTLPVTYLIAWFKRKPFILWTGVWMRLQTRTHRYFFPLTRYIYRHADAIVVYGEHIKRYLVSEGVHPDRIFIAAHAIDNTAYADQVSEEECSALRRALQISPNQKIVLYLGRLEEEKGLVYLLQAFATLQRDDAVLVIAGDGTQRSTLEQLAHESGISDRIRFTGYIPSDQTLKYYAVAWVHVLPSITTAVFKEPWGLVVNESFNQGVPVIATDAVGAAAGGLVKDEINGFVVPERNSMALTKALRRILDDHGLHKDMSNNARQTIAQWNNERMVSGFQQAIMHVTDKR